LPCDFPRECTGFSTGYPLIFHSLSTGWQPQNFSAC